MKTTLGILCLLLFYGLGEAIAHYSHAPVPGAVIGMLLLFALLKLSNRSTPDWLKQGSSFLIRLLSLFFLPAGVGLFFLPAGFDSQWPAIIAAIVVATILSLGLTALVMQKMLAISKTGEQP